MNDYLRGHLAAVSSMGPLKPPMFVQEADEYLAANGPYAVPTSRWDAEDDPDVEPVCPDCCESWNGERPHTCDDEWLTYVRAGEPAA